MRKILLASVLALATACVPELPSVCQTDTDCGEGTCTQGYCTIPPPTIDAFLVDQATITTTQSASLSFTFTNGKGSVDSGVGDVVSGTPVDVSPTTTTTYTLAVKNSTWPEVTKTVTLNVLPLPTITSFNATNATITNGQSTTLTAVFAGGTGAVDSGVGAVTSGSPKSISPTSTTTYKLTVTTATGVKTDRTVTVTVIPPPTITSFVAAAGTITNGKSTTLTAIFADGTGTIDNSVGDVTTLVPVAVSPTVTTTYTLTVTTATGFPVTATVTVTVVDPAVITSFAPADAAMSAGGSTTLTASFTGGSGDVDRGVGAVTTDVPVNITLPTTKSVLTYMLTVTNAAGDSVSEVTTVTVIAGPVTSLVLVRSPATGTKAADGSIAEFFALTVTVEDQYANRANDVPVFISSDGVSDVFDPPTSQLTDGSGQATWSLRSTRAGTKTITATAQGDTATDTETVTFTAGTATRLVFIQEPTNAVAGANISPTVTVAAVDVVGNVVTTASGTVTLAISTNPGSSTLTGGAATSYASGIATFAGLRLNKVGTGYRLTASSSPALNTAASAPFDVSVGSAARLAFGQQPSTVQAANPITPAVTVKVQDANSNDFTTSTASVTITASCIVSSGGGPISAVSGVATFTRIRVTTTGSCTLTAASSPLISATSNSFTVNPGATQNLVFTTQPQTPVVAGVAMSPSVVVAVKDASNNTVTTATGNVTLSVIAGTTAALIGTNTRPLLSGVATFSNVVTDKVGTSYELRATPDNSTYGLGTSSSYEVTVGAVSASVSTVVYDRYAFGDNIDLAAVVVTVMDAYQNPVSGKTVTLTSTGTGNTFSAAAATNASGVYNGTIRSNVIQTKTLTVTVTTPTVVLATTPLITFTKIPATVFALATSDARLMSLNADPDTGDLIHAQHVVVGNNPRGVSVDPLGRFLHVTSYDAHSVYAYTVNGSYDNDLTYVGKYATGTNPWGVATDSEGKFLYVANVATDNVSVYTVPGATGALTAGTAVAAGDAPYGLVIAQPGLPTAGKFLYVSNNTAGTVSAFNINLSSGALTTIGTYTAAAQAYPGLVAEGAGNTDFLYVPNYTSNSISVFAINPSSGALSPNPGTLVATGSSTGPVSLAVDPSGRFLFAANYSNSTVRTWSINNTTGALTGIGSNVAAGGSNPRMVTVDPSGAYLYISFGGTNEIRKFSIDPDTGMLTAEQPVRMRGTSFGMGQIRAAVRPQRTGKFVYAVNQSTNNIATAAINQSTGAITAVSGSPFNIGISTIYYPQGIGLHPSGKFVYTANTNLDNVNGLNINPGTGALTAISPISSFVGGNGPVSVAFSPNGDHAFVTAYNDDNVRVYSVGTSGALTYKYSKTAGDGPYNAAVDPTGRYYYVPNYSSNSVSFFKITTDGLTDGGGGPYATGTSPRSAEVDPSGRYLYVSNWARTAGGSSISGYTINASNGQLTLMATSPFATGTSSQPTGLSVHPTGLYLYVANYQSGSNNVLLMNIDPSTGALSAPTGTAASTYMWDVAVEPSGKYLYGISLVNFLMFPFTIGAAGTLTAGTSVTTGASGYPNGIVVRGPFPPVTCSPACD